ncbi:MAG: protein-export chaperone SecB [Pseudomonadota bacterium]
MADEQTNGAAKEGAEAPAQPRLQVITQYIRDLSFENIAVQKSMKLDGNPEVAVQVALDANKRDESVFEVITKVKIDSKVQDQSIFIMELEYAGQFRVENVPDAQLHPFLMIECPRMIFPYLRRIVGDITRDGGFPPLNLENIDFLSIYRQEVARRQKEQQAAAPAS